MGQQLAKLLGFERADKLLRNVLLGRVLPYGVLLLAGRSFAAGGARQSFARKALHAAAIAALGCFSPFWFGLLRIGGQAAKLDQQQLPGPDTPIELRDNKDRINEWVLEKSREYGFGRTWHIGPATIITSPAAVKHILKDRFEVRGANQPTRARLRLPPPVAKSPAANEAALPPPR
jgi:hypothetical protein